VSSAKTAVPIEMQSGMLSRVGPWNHLSDRGAHWHNLANMTEPSACGGDSGVTERRNGSAPSQTFPRHPKER